MSLNKTRVVIMVGGKGTRLRPLTISIPKPLVPVGDYPILKIMLNQLQKAGFKDFTFTLGYLGSLIEAFLANSSKEYQDLCFHFTYEREPTGTAGSLCNLKGLENTFLVMNGDILTNLDYNKLLAFHWERNADFTIASYRKRVKIQLGVLSTNKDGWLINYDEKPIKHYTVSMGINVLEPVALKYISYGEYMDMPTLLLKMVEDGRKVAVYQHDGIWFDIGNHDDLEKAQDLWVHSRSLFNIDKLLK